MVEPDYWNSPEIGPSCPDTTPSNAMALDCQSDIWQIVTLATVGQGLPGHVRNIGDLDSDCYYPSHVQTAGQDWLTVQAGPKS